MKESRQISKTGNENEIAPNFKKNNIPIILACDDKYVPYTSVLLTSLFENSSDNNNYDILLFQKDITDKNKEKLKSCLKQKENLSLRFIDISAQIKNFNLRTFSYYSVEIYFRLFAPWVLKKYDKILYFDCDLVFNADVAKLYKKNIGDNLLGAVRDIGMIQHKNNPKSGIPKTYFSDHLMGINIDNYFNSGVLVMNLKKFRDEFKLEEIMKLIESKKWFFPDQDVLNVLCAKKTFILPCGWNTIPENSGDRKLELLPEFVPEKYLKPYLRARKMPLIVHYAMREKPWKWSINLDMELGLVFWKYALRSPLASEVLKIKSKTCSISEIIFILNKIKEVGFAKKEEKNDITYLFKGIKISSYSSKIVKFETAEIEDGYFKIDGWFVVSSFEDMPNKVFFESGKIKATCDVFDKNQDEFIAGELVSKTYVFKAKIPLQKIALKNEFKVVFLVNEKEIIATAYNYGRFFPTDRIFKEQYFYKSGFILKCSSNSVTIFPATKKQAKKEEKKFLKRLKAEGGEINEKAVTLRKIYNFVKPKLKKQIWLVSDNFLADDNGFAFFEYLCKTKPKGIKFFFAISRANERYEELKRKYKGKILTYETPKFKIYSLLADVKISSVVDFYFIRPFKTLEHNGRDIFARQKFVFLQHGVTSNDMSREHNKFVYNPKLIITTSKLEQEEFRRPCYFYEKNQILLTGFSRFDKLYEDSQKLITIMPTWRKYVIFKNNRKVKISDEEFKKSTYFKFYFALLNNEKLNNFANKYGYKICFMQHPLFIDYNHCFECENQRYQILNEKHRDVFAKSNLLVSDYSSVIFDFLYLRKPIIYTHFDSNEFYSGSHAYDKGFIDHENDGFGECEFTLEGTVNRIIEYMKNGCKIKKKYLDKVNNFFGFDDKNNSKRIFESIKQMLASFMQEKDLKYYQKKFNEIRKKYGMRTALKWTNEHFKRLRRKNDNE